MEHSEETIEKRKERVLSFLKQKKEWIYYIVLSAVIYAGFYVRTLNISKLRDITTNDWTLAPDLDPYLFLRWAKYIVEHGTLMAHDAMRYIPVGYDTAGEMKLLSYMMAWFYDVFHFFDKSVSVTYAAIWFPVIMFVFTAIAFFLFARKIFYRENSETKNIIALIATAFFVLVPSWLPRSIAGIPEKESVAFGFMFLAFYLYLEATTSEKFRNKIILGFFAGISTALMALVWGGVIFVFFSIPTAVFFAFLLGKVKRDEITIYFVWLISSFAFMTPFSTRYSPLNLAMSTSTGFAIGVLFIIIFGLIFMRFGKIEEIRKKTNIPKELFSAIISIFVLLTIVTIILGPDFIFGQIREVTSSLINPQTSRFGMTVAENKQPYFINDWKENFGPVFKEIPLFFWLFFTGAIVLFNRMIEKMEKKEKIILTFGYFVFLAGLIFSKYSSGGNLNGSSGLSVLIYFGGLIFFVATFGRYYYVHKKNESNIFEEFDFAYILYFIVLTLGIIGARSGIRLMMSLGLISPIAIAFLVVISSKRYFAEKEDMMKFFLGCIVAILVLSSVFTLWVYYKSDVNMGSNYAPSAYNFQWQKAMSWVRENTSENAVFAHWWDYGYWVQSIGNRATILDGGNAMGSWDYYMGRLVLTNPTKNIKDTMDYLYTHNATHLLIDSTEIGKYAAFSSIGSDLDYDRISYIPTLLMDAQQTRKNGNETNYIYPAGFSTDSDVLINSDGKEILLPRKMAGIGAIILTTNDSAVIQPRIIFVYNGKQYEEKLRYAYINNNLYDFNSGIDAGVFVFPKVQTESGQGQINNFGAMFYLSPRVVHSNLAQFYLFDQKSDYFKLAHTESNLFIDNLKQQNIDIGEFVYFQGFQGPIKIWEIKYPDGVKTNPQYLSTDYPDPELDTPKFGEY
ncbi:hypothetical protein HY449_02950 [Candidatus Pacearchaeota archaeon]|nr:hypothetical protein [Candidatus Pacearchaeota archaeon]